MYISNKKPKLQTSNQYVANQCIDLIETRGYLRLYELKELKADRLQQDLKNNWNYGKYLSGNNVQNIADYLVNTCGYRHEVIETGSNRGSYFCHSSFKFE